MYWLGWCCTLLGRLVLLAQYFYVGVGRVFGYVVSGVSVVDDVGADVVVDVVGAVDAVDVVSNVCAVCYGVDVACVFFVLLILVLLVFGVCL